MRTFNRRGPELSAAQQALIEHLEAEVLFLREQVAQLTAQRQERAKAHAESQQKYRENLRQKSESEHELAQKRTVGDITVISHPDFGSPRPLPRTLPSSKESPSGIRKVSPSQKNKPAVDDKSMAVGLALEKGYAQDQAGEMYDDFFDFWESRGWRDRAGPIRDWVARWRTWIRNEQQVYHRYQRDIPHTLVL